MLTGDPATAQLKACPLNSSHQSNGVSIDARIWDLVRDRSGQIACW